jgi:hypothetical protein
MYHKYPNVTIGSVKHVDVELFVEPTTNYILGCFCWIFKFGDSQKLRLIRILQSSVMVRVGGGWMALDEFLVKNDPCRGLFIL